MCVGHHLHKICSCFDCMKNFPCSSSWSAWGLPLIQRRLPCDKLMQISWVMRRMVRAAKRVCGLWGHPRGVVLQEKIDNQSSATSSSHPQNAPQESHPHTAHQLPHLHGHSFLVIDRALRGLLLRIWLLPPQSPQHCSGDESDGEPLHMLDSSPVTIRRRPNGRLQPLWD